jgi:hypothetical protein
MISRLITALVALLMLGFVVAGCGDDEGSDGSGEPNTAAETTRTDDSTRDAEPAQKPDAKAKPSKGSDKRPAGSDAPPAETATPATREEQVDRCQKGVTSYQGLSRERIEHLQDLCAKAGSEDEEDVEEAAQEICATFVNGVKFDGAEEREAALSRCVESFGKR